MLYHSLEYIHAATKVTPQQMSEIIYVCILLNIHHNKNCFKYDGYLKSKDTKSRKYLQSIFFLHSLVALLQHTFIYFST
jgi:hypothetical protein